MKNNNIFVVISNEKDGKHNAFALKVSRMQNLASLTKDSKYISSLNVFETWKEAQEVARFWNKCYENNGTYEALIF